jgi:hypothetical protein
MGKCNESRCKNATTVIHKGKPWYYKKCSKHRSRRYKASKPLRYYYNLARCRAKRRGIAFNLSFEFYEKLVNDAGWDETKRGRSATDLSIDRIDATRGYEEDNVQVISIGENAAKGDTDTSWLKHYGPYGQFKTNTHAEDNTSAPGENDDPW